MGACQTGRIAVALGAIFGRRRADARYSQNDK